MTGDAGSAALRELLLVVAVAMVGLLLAMAAAFGPWPPVSGGGAPRAGLVEVHSPAGGAGEPTRS
ncbi:hypothetical protein ACIBPB_17260 [Micromonospora sp. NPDC049836]|uniref:hypothetical protein n=1 Tax=Micromonospora sp. NPDC049836 TaxID=3364274 RepID=UPI0037B84A0C